MNKTGWRIIINILFGSGGMAVMIGNYEKQAVIGFVVLLIFNFAGYWALDKYAGSRRENHEENLKI